MSSMSSTAWREIDRALWCLYKHLPRGTVESMKSVDLAAFIHELLPGTELHDVAQRVRQVRRYRRQLVALKQLPQVAQRSSEWYAQRQGRLTASDLAQALGKGKFGTRDDLLRKKIQERAGNSPPFPSLPPLVWGTMFEPMAARMYSERNGDITLHEFGLLPHPTIPHFGASPDSISELGIMVEFKCPYRRKIDGMIPEQYELQMQGQLAVCNLGECDYVECMISALRTADEYVQSLGEGARTDHGVIVEFRRGTTPYYEYNPANQTPQEALAWSQAIMKQVLMSQEDVELVRHWFWKLDQIHICRVHFNEALWSSCVPQIAEFWENVVKGDLPPEKPKRPRLGKPEVNVAHEFLDESDPET